MTTSGHLEALLKHEFERGLVLNHFTHSHTYKAVARACNIKVHQVRAHKDADAHIKAFNENMDSMITTLKEDPRRIGDIPKEIRRRVGRLARMIHQTAYSKQGAGWPPPKQRQPRRPAR